MGLVLMHVLVEWLHVHEVIAPMAILLLTLPVAFLLSRKIIATPSSRPRPSIRSRDRTVHEPTE
jgi:hypothetical protein